MVVHQKATFGWAEGGFGEPTTLAVVDSVVERYVLF